MAGTGRWALLALVGCLVVGLGVGPAAGADAGTAVVADGLTATVQDDGDLEYHEYLENASAIYVDVDLQDDGDATVSVEYRFEDVDTNGWQGLSDEVENESAAYTAREEVAWADVASEGANATNREMTLSGFEVEATERSAPRDVGQVVFTFDWAAFAYVELNRLELDDTLTGFTLVDDTTLQVTWPDRYVVTDIEPRPVDQPTESARWDGDDTEFGDGQPTLILLENGDEAEVTVGGDDESESSWLVLIAGLGLVTTIGLVTWWVRRSNEGTTTATRRPSDGEPEPTPAPDRPPADLLSNEERVLRLLEDNGGRLKQQAVVAELEWTEAKTSQVVSRLREDEQIEVFRIGRENVLALPAEDEP